MKRVTLGIEGMMCGMCESHINDVIRKIYRVEKIDSNHNKNRTVFLTNDEVNEDLIRENIKETGYKLTSVKVEEYEKKGFFSSWKD